MKEIIDITPPTFEEALLEMLRQAVAENEKALYEVDMKRYNEMQRALYLISEIVMENDPDANIESGFCELYRSDGYITILTTDIGANAFDMPSFQEVISLATSFDVLPAEKGERVRCGMTFANVMHKRI